MVYYSYVKAGTLRKLKSVDLLIDGKTFVRCATDDNELHKQFRSFFYYFRLISLQSEAKICEKIIIDVIIRYIIAGHNPQKAYLQTPTPKGCVCVWI